MSTNAPFINAEGIQQLVLTEKRQALLKTMLHCTETACLRNLSNTFHRAEQNIKLRKYHILHGIENHIFACF